MKKLLTFFAFLSIIWISVAAERVQIGELFYNLDSSSKTAEVTYEKQNDYNNYKSLSGEVIIPETVVYGATTYSVISIGTEAFFFCSGLTSVTIPNSVTSIATDAFRGCSSLQTIDVDTSNQNYASQSGVLFSKDLDTLILCPGGYTGAYTIPSSVTSIGNEAFLLCTSLTSIEIPNSVTSIGDWAFTDCSGLTSVSIPNSVTSIGDDAFYGCRGLTSVTIPNSVTSIGNYAFYECSGLTNVTIGNSVTSIGHDAFSGCWSLQTFDVDASNQVYASQSGVLFSKDLDTLILCPEGYTGAYSIPKSVTSIGDHAFFYCWGLTSVVIPNSVTSIGYFAFEYCTGLKSVTIPNSVTSIGNGAFSRCSGLTSIEIPNSVTSIGAGAFQYCSGLTSIEIPNSVTSIGEGAFSRCNSLTSVNFPASLSSLGRLAFVNCENLETITFNSDRPLALGESVFRSCNSISKIYCNTTQPPESNDFSVFENVVYSNANLYVPEKDLSKYYSMTPWSNFFNIIGTDTYPDESGITNVKNQDELVNVYDLSGVLLHKNFPKNNEKDLAPGIYIIGGKKVIIR